MDGLPDRHVLRPGATVALELAARVPERVYPDEFALFTFDHVVNGTIEASGEEPGDRWRLEVRDNTVFVVEHTQQPSFDEISDAEPVVQTEFD